MQKQLCPDCKTGKRMYELDPMAPECPYLSMHNGKTCPMYEGADELKPKVGRDILRGNSTE